MEAPAVLATVGPISPAVEPGTETDLADSRLSFAGALDRRDAAAAAAVYADDARLVMPSVGVIEGRAAISSFWKAGLDTGLVQIEYETDALHTSQQTAYEMGRYAMHLIDGDSGSVIERGDYALVHHRDAAGRWLRQLEMFSPGATK